jgi:hypothetical protein
MRRERIDQRLRIVIAAIALAPAVGCVDSDGLLPVLLVALKVFAGLVVAVVVFLPLMASLATIRAAVRRYLGSRRRDRESR